MFRDDEFCNVFSLDHFIKTRTCYMGTNTFFIGDIITNTISFFVKYCAVEMGISDYHKLVMPICQR